MSSTFTSILKPSTFLAAALLLCGVEISAQQVDTTFWVPNGTVNSIVLHDTTVILGGSFDQVSPVSGSFVRMDTSTAQFDRNRFKVNGPVYVTHRDTNGYIYVGGNFSRVGNQNVENLFRLTPAGTFDNTFIHSVEGTVYALRVQDTTLFIGGAFTMIDGETRNNFGGIDVNTGLLSACDPNVNGAVYCMDIDSSNPFVPRIIIGGAFTNVGTFNPPYLAKISLETGYPFTFNAVPWTALPNVNGPVYDIQIIGNRVYVAGEFTLFGPTSRPGLGVILNSSGALQSDNAQIVGAVYDMEFVDTNIYIGGRFTSVSNQPRNNLACVSTALAVQPWNPDANGEVRTITVIDSVYFFAGGNFSMVGAVTAERGARIERVSGAVANWNPVFNAPVYTAVADTFHELFVGGAFFGANGVKRNNLCAISTNTGVPTAWNPDVNAQVNCMTLDGDSLYFAGSFTTVGSMGRGRIAAIDLQSQQLLPFNPVVNGLVRTIAITGSEVYAGGNFTSFGGQTRNNIGKVNKATGLATTWNPNCYGTVNTILATSHWIYVAGFYTNIGGQSRQNLARIHPQTGLADWGWSCNTDDGVFHAEFYNGKMAMVGWFSTVNGLPATEFAIIDTTTLALSPVSFDTDGFVRTFTTYGDDFFIAGTFNLVNFVFHPGLVAYDEGDGALDVWTPLPDAPPATMQATATRLYIGGAMTATGGRFHPNFQVLSSQWVTSIGEHQRAAATLDIYPNPASDRVTVRNVDAYDMYTLTDITGQVVQTGTITGTQLEISLQEVSTGIYFLNVSGKDVVPVSQRIIRN